jgi:hypothetical protein
VFRGVWAYTSTGRPNTSKCSGRFHEHGSGVILIPCGKGSTFELSRGQTPHTIQDDDFSGGIPCKSGTSWSAVTYSGTREMMPPTDRRVTSEWPTIRAVPASVLVQREMERERAVSHFTWSQERRTRQCLWYPTSGSGVVFSFFSPIMGHPLRKPRG